MNARLLVFARAPVAGCAKTRLIPALGATGAARLHERLLDDALQRARAAGPRTLELWGTGDDPHGTLAALAERHGAVLHEQVAGDLGRRMGHALERATGDGVPAFVMGTDSPGLASTTLRAADDMLADADAVLGPALDGGYVLLGLHRPAPQLFERIEWGTERVLGETRRRLAALGWRPRELAPHWDVDRPEDLERLAALGEPWSDIVGAGAA